MWILLNILIISTFTAIIPMPGVADIFWIPKEFIFNILGFSLIASSFIGKREKTISFSNTWIGLIFIYTILLFGWYFYKPLVFNAGNTVTWNFWTIRPTINVVLGILLIKTLTEYTDSLNRWVSVAKVLCWLALGFAVYGILQYLYIDQIFNDNVKRVNGFNTEFSRDVYMVTLMGHRILTANLLAVVSPLFLMFKGLRYKISYLVLIIAILLTQSAVSIFAVAIGFLLYLILTKNWKMFLACAITLGGIGFYVMFAKNSFFSFSGRPEIWGVTLSHWLHRPFTGFGLGSFAANKFMFGKAAAASAHCEFLQIMYEGGLVMFSLVVIYIASLFKRIVMTKDSMLLTGYTCSFVAFILVSLANFPLRIAPLALVGILYIASLEAQLI